MDIKEVIAAAQPVLTEKQRSITDYMMNNIDIMTFITLRELAKNSGCTEVTILKLCKKLGFETFGDLKNAFRAYKIRPDMSSESKENNAASDIKSWSIEWPEDSEDIAPMLEKLINYEKDSIANYLDSLDYELLKTVADKSMKARIVYVVGRGTSLDVADCFRRRLSTLGLNAQLINPEDTSSIQASLNKLSTEDMFLFITYPMYYLPLINIADFVNRSHCFSAAITDCKSAPISDYCDCVIETGRTGGGYYYSFSHPMITTNIITNMIQFMMQQEERKNDIGSLLELIGPADFVKG